MKGILNRIINKVNRSTSPSSLRELEIARKYKRPFKKEDHTVYETTSNPSDQQEESQVVDILIKMKDHLHLTKINSTLQGQYRTLRHINHMLCSNPIKIEQIRVFLRTKSSEIIDLESEQYEQLEPSQKRSVRQYFTLYSNGLIYQFYSVRALLWKVSIGYLPAHKNKWVSVMEGSLIYYHECINEHILQIVVKTKVRKDSIQISERRTESQYERSDYYKKQAVDHPLNSFKKSKWKTLFEDKQLWQIIEKDTIRTKPNCKFFREEFEIEIEELENYHLQKGEVHLSKDRKKTFYYDCLTRIIYIFLKKNPEFVYCQGMNEVAALIFYSFANKNSEYFRRVAESDAFLCFEKIIKQLNKLPIPGFLNGQKYSLRFEELLKRIDLRLYEELAAKKGTLDSLRILSIKWYNSLFLNQYGIDQTLILWDGFISTICKEETSSISFHNLLLAIGLALVHLNRKALSQGESPMLVFAKLPNPPEALLEKALSLYKIFGQFF